MDENREAYLRRWAPRCPVCGAVGHHGDQCESSRPSPVELDWQTSAEHRGLQGVAFPEVISRGEQGALL